jgi:hypothetical protein
LCQCRLAFAELVVEHAELSVSLDNATPLQEPEDACPHHLQYIGDVGRAQQRQLRELELASRALHVHAIQQDRVKVWMKAP